MFLIPFKIDDLKGDVRCTLSSLAFPAFMYPKISSSGNSIGFNSVAILFVVPLFEPSPTALNSLGFHPFSSLVVSLSHRLQDCADTYGTSSVLLFTFSL